MKDKTRIQELERENATLRHALAGLVDKLSLTRESVHGCFLFPTSVPFSYIHGSHYASELTAALDALEVPDDLNLVVHGNTWGVAREGE